MQAPDLCSWLCNMGRARNMRIATHRKSDVGMNETNHFESLGSTQPDQIIRVDTDAGMQSCSRGKGTGREGNGMVRPLGRGWTAWAVGEKKRHFACSLGCTRKDPCESCTTKRNWIDSFYGSKLRSKASLSQRSLQSVSYSELTNFFSFRFILWNYHSNSFIRHCYDGSHPQHTPHGF